MTVCEGIARKYEDDLGVKPIVVTNATGYKEIKPHATNPAQIRMIHHGNANSSRKIENMINMMDYLDDRFELDLLLVKPPWSKRYMKMIKKLTSNGLVLGQLLFVV